MIQLEGPNTGCINLAYYDKTSGKYLCNNGSPNDDKCNINLPLDHKTCISYM